MVCALDAPGALLALAISCLGRQCSLEFGGAARFNFLTLAVLVRCRGLRLKLGAIVAVLEICARPVVSLCGIAGDVLALTV